jgi:hypothetical protein
MSDLDRQYEWETIDERNYMEGFTLADSLEEANEKTSNFLEDGGLIRVFRLWKHEAPHE